MGPRSDNRGYVPERDQAIDGIELQWVHGRITVVMCWSSAAYGNCTWSFNGSTVG